MNEIRFTHIADIYFIKSTMKKRKRHDYKYDVDRLKRLGYDMENIITKFFMAEEHLPEITEESLYRYKRAKYVTHPDSSLLKREDGTYRYWELINGKLQSVIKYKKTGLRYTVMF